MSTTRKAADLLGSAWKRYQTDGHFQDIVETVGGASVAAVGQALLTDMSPEEIALSAIIGAGAGMAARPLLARAGYAGGRYLDKKMPGAQDYGGIMSPTSPRGQEILRRIVDEVGGPGTADKDIMLKLLAAKGNQNFIRPDGSSRGYIEGTLGSFVRNRGDNATQALVAVATPFLLGQDDDLDEQALA